MKYRRKEKPSDVVEAVQYTGKNWQELREFTGRGLSYDKARPDSTVRMAADDGFNNLIIEPTDWVVKYESTGPVHKISNSSFTRTFEAIPD